VGLPEVAAWWELVVFVYSKLKRSKKKKLRNHRALKEVVEGRGLFHGWRDGVNQAEELDGRLVGWEERSSNVRRAARSLVWCERCLRLRLTETGLSS
jgi:hypothetical protein